MLTPPAASPLQACFLLCRLGYIGNTMQGRRRSAWAGSSPGLSTCFPGSALLCLDSGERALGAGGAPYGKGSWSRGLGLGLVCSCAVECGQHGLWAERLWRQKG